MMDLVLIVDNYPVLEGEYFVDNEVQAICTAFDKIYVLTEADFSTSTRTNIPENVEIISSQRTVGWLRKFTSIPHCAQSFFLNELIRQSAEHGFWSVVSIFKIMFMDLVKADLISKQLSNLISEKKIDIGNTVFYSYWHDYKALALTRMKDKNINLRCVSRAHGWDVFKFRHDFPFLPFKKYMISHLDLTISISEAGKKELLTYVDRSIAQRITVSKLGISNPRTKKMIKESNSYLICSCSNVIPVKRLHLIADILSEVNCPGIKWVHFGDGPLRKDVLSYLQEKYPGIEVEFKGTFRNSEILDYYENNFVDLFMNVSESEGIPVSIMEALSSGIPVLATDVGGNGEIVGAGHGFLIDKNLDAASAAKIIDDYLGSSHDTHLKYRENAAAYWEQHYTAKINYTEFTKLLTGK